MKEFSYESFYIYKTFRKTAFLLACLCLFIPAASLADGFSMNIVDGVLTSYAGTVPKHLIIPENVKKIASGVFSGNQDIETVVFPDELEVIDSGAFSWSGLTEIHIPGSFEKIGNGVFQECRDLKNIILEEGITSISNAAFSASGLERIFFPESMTTFESAGIFADTNNLMVIKFLARDPQFTRGEDFFGDYDPIRTGSIQPTVYGYKGTQAEALARKANLVFVPLEEEDGETLKNEEKFNALDAVEVPTILVKPDQEGELTFEMDKDANKKNTIVYNVHLRDEYNGKPKALEDECILCFPYPEGLDENSSNKYRIVIHHYAGNGKTEVFKSEDGDIEFTKQGLCIRVSSFSPFEIAWESGGQHLPETGDASSLWMFLAALILSCTALSLLRRRTC